MSHRFPIQEKVFPPLQLSDSAREKFVNTALMQLSRALRDYDKYQKWQASRPPSLRYQLHPAMWKPVKTCEQLTVYRRVPADDAVVTAPSGGTRRRARSRTLEAMRLPRGTDSDSVSSAPKDSNNDAWPFPNRGSNPTGNSEWNMPTLLQVGSIEGTLDDVMYGTATFDGTGTLIKSSYTAEEVVDADTLYEIQGPTANDPFRFLGLKWVVKATSPAVKAFVWPRDLTFIAATGVLNREGGERVGYHMMHSVDLGKGFGPLEGKRIVRGRVSSCFLYRQTSGNTVDVYMKTNFEPNGSVHESVALLSAANSLTYCLKAALCAQNKKLSWLLAHPKTDETAAGSARPSSIKIKKRNDCGVCMRPMGTFSRAYSCRVCSIRACSTCVVKKKLYVPGQSYKAIDERSVVICTHCLTDARKLNSMEIAKLEIVERKRLDQRRGTLRGTEVPERITRSQSRPEPDRQRRGTVIAANSDRTLGKGAIDVDKVFHTAPVRRMSRTPRPTQRKVEPKAAPARDYNSETGDSNPAVQRPADSRKTISIRKTTTRSGSRKTITKPTPVKKQTSNPAPAAQRDVWDVDSDTEDSDDRDQPVVSSRAVSMHPEIDDSLPEAVVEYAWGEVVPSPTTNTSSEAWPSPPSSPLASPTPLPKETGAPSWPTSEGERATVWTAPPMPQIPRIHAGASTQEVLAQFAELCNAAENVYQAARKHTITHLDPAMLPTRQTTTRLDMSALD
ncbi:Zinc finger, RING/FYVE/PHD-type [Phytophthora cinnamomi]|uniref:Zinc finger, RING/FYVE/PHD-type n=1 Tax=Phytophthora cinnamomi TaxID=4785 RepID=UPI00355A4F3E|nr:Zinc finger, RING/FYVE/PHD-type [Phytophthora cinnamomi]